MVHAATLDLPIFVLLFLGLSIGVLNGFTGVGGGFIVTPVLILLGVPAGLATGTSLCWVFLNSLTGAALHRKLGHTDVKLALFIAFPSLIGVEFGVRLATLVEKHGFQDAAILSVSILIMALIGIYTLIECIKNASSSQLISQATGNTQPSTGFAIHLSKIKLAPMIKFNKTGVEISFWIILLLGLFIGTLTGFIGTGGGFIVMPVLMYVIGVPALLAVGTSTLQVVISSLYGGSRYFFEGSVIFPIVLILLSTSVPGVFIGSSVTKQVRGVVIKLVLSITIMFTCVGSIFKLIWLLSEETFYKIQELATLITFIGMTLSMGLVFLLKIFIRQYQAGRHLPSLVALFIDRNILNKSVAMRKDS